MLKIVSKEYHKFLMLTLGEIRLPELKKFKGFLSGQLLFMLIYYLSFIMTDGMLRRSSLVALIVMIGICIVHSLAFGFYLKTIRPLLIRLVPYLTHHLSLSVFLYYLSWYFKYDEAVTFLVLTGLDAAYQLINLVYQCHLMIPYSIEDVREMRNRGIRTQRGIVGNKLLDRLYYPLVWLLITVAIVLFLGRLFRLDIRLLYSGIYVLTVFNRQVTLHWYAQSIDFKNILE